ncbi:MAG: protein kinase [Bryobacteraceae bacterium]|jgi:serine/threonine protein kinase
MTSERWRKIEELYHAALDCGPVERASFLAGACGGDDELRRQIEVMLAQDSGGGILDSPAAELLSESTVPLSSGRSLAAGDKLGIYQIVALIGVGGMGEVYRAKDTRLKREVALKVLPDTLARDPERLSRFEREAKVLASLNHPNIAQIYGVEERALVMELVPGENLKGPLPIETALLYAKQVAEALEAAHEKGIIHRDLKPANVKVTPEGVVKVLDFGLARAAEESTDPSEASTGLATHAGTILGTAAYMSPEQAIGKSVDRRADIWSFGVVLWELLTGRRLFGGESFTQTLAEVVRGPIDFDPLPPETPAGIRRLLVRCLDRNVKNRLRDIGEARIAIDSALACETPLLERAQRTGGTRRWLGWSVAAALAVSMAPVAFLHFREKPPASQVPLRFQIAPGSHIAPDGRKIARIVPGRLWIQSLESGESRDLAAADNVVPFWSPDSRFIGYADQGKLKKVEAAGGPPQTVADLRSDYVWGDGAWNQNDVIVFGDRPIGLFRVPASGGVPVQITALDPARHENSQYSPSFLPDERHFVYIRASTDEGKSAIYLGSVDAGPKQQSSSPLVATNSQPRYAPSADPGTGYLLFVRAGNLMAQPFDNRLLELKGQPTLVAGQVRNNVPGATFVNFSASANDVLVFPRNAIPEMQLTWYDREGNVTGTAGEPGLLIDFLRLSPDGTRAAVPKSNGTADAFNIGLLDLSRGGTSTRFTFGSLIDTEPVWAPEGPASSSVPTGTAHTTCIKSRRTA